MVPAAPAEKFFQRLRDDRGDRPSRRARMLPGRCGEPHGKPDSEDRVFFRDPDPARDRRLAGTRAASAAAAPDSSSPAAALTCPAYSAAPARRPPDMT